MLVAEASVAAATGGIGTGGMGTPGDDEVRAQVTANGTDTTAEHSGLATPVSSAAAEKRWPACCALLTAWLLPATTARRTAHVLLSRAYAVHWLALVLAALLALLLAGWTVHLDRDAQSDGVFAETTELAADIIAECMLAPLPCLLVGASVVLGVELTFLGLAVLLTPWGARDEPIRASIANALRRVWLQTSHVLPAFLLIAVFANGVMLVQRQWERAQRDAGRPAKWSIPPPQPPAGASADSQAGRDYQEGLDQYSKEMQALSAAHLAYWQSRPWYFRYDEEAIGYGCFAVVTWFLWALFRAVGAPRVVQPMAWPPLCESCGFNLTAAAIDSRCPECGGPVERSLGPGVRPGTAWQRARGFSRAQALWRCSVDAICRPAVFGLQIQHSPASAAHRWLVAPALALVFVVLAISYILSVFLGLGLNPWTWDRDAVLVEAPVFGASAVVVALCVMLVTAWLVALYYRLSDNRNLLHAAMQIAAYLGGYVVLWALISGLAGAAAFGFDDWFRRMALVLGIDRELLTFGAWFLPNLVCLIGFVYLVRRGTGAARYANR